jgi:hypothetical protein
LGGTPATFPDLLQAAHSARQFLGQLVPALVLTVLAILLFVGLLRVLEQFADLLLELGVPCEEIPFSDSSSELRNSVVSVSLW